MAFPAPTPRSPGRQQGGTLLGFVLGLVVGIGIALAVAVYVTKVPIPLVDRGVQRKPTQPETEAERLKSWNPNADLAPAKPPVPAQPSTEATGAAPAAQPAPAPGADPIAELLRQRADTSQPAAGEADAGTAAVAADPFNYFVQVGAFRSADEAEAQRARLALQGFSASVSEREQAGQRIYRVRLGPFGNKVEAEVMQERLRVQKFETALVRVQR